MVSSNTTAVFYTSNDHHFIRKLSNSNYMYTKITPYNESPVSATFNLNGLSNALKPLQAACNWK
ncbi:type VI secretion protein [Escherichia coli]